MASFELVDLGLIRKVAAVGVPVILSTGMATYGEVEDALDAVAQTGNRQVALLRCASLYPAPPEIMTSARWPTLRAAFGVPVGLSDHTTGIAMAARRAAFEANVLEKHFTLSRQSRGPTTLRAGAGRAAGAWSQPCATSRARSGTAGSRGPQGRRQLRCTGWAGAPSSRRANRRETDIAGHDAHGQRPGFGIAPKHIDLVVGRHARVDIAVEDVITWEMV